MAEVNIVTPINQPQSATGVIPQPQTNAESVLISGTISGRDTNGNFLLKTQNGTIALQSNVPLTYNSDVVLRLTQNAAQGTNNARIISVNGEAFSEFSQPQQAESDSVSTLLSQTQSTATAASNETQPSNTDTIQAVVVSSPSDATAENSPQPQTQGVNPQPALPTGTNVIIRLPTPITPPAQAQSATAQLSEATQQQGAVAQPSTPQAVTQIITTTAQNPTQAPSPQLPAQPVLNTNTNASDTNASRTAQPAHAAPTAAQFQGAIMEQAVEETEQTASSPLYAAYARQVTIGDTQQAPQTTSTTAATSGAEAATPTVIQGQVSYVAKNGTITVQTPAGPVTLKADALPANRLTPGTTITIELAQTGTQSTASIPTPAASSGPPASFAELASSWGSFKAIVSLLMGSDDASDASTSTTPATPSNIPALGPNFVSSSLSFISSLSSGNANKILGDDAVNNLKNSGQSNLLQRFTSEVSTMVNTATAKPDQPVPTWQATFLPFVYQGEPQQARIYVKRDGQNKKQSSVGKAGDGGGTRFIVEVDLSEMGGVQMDGLIRKKQANTVFDLMIRSNTEFTPQERAEITDIYNEAAQLTGFSGSLSFQTVHDFPVKPLDEIMANQNKVVVA